MADSPATPRLSAPSAPTPDATGEFGRLLELMRLLRSGQGCPWDREQTWTTLAPFVLEEAYEVVDAIEQDDPAQVCGEIGDLVFEGVFLAQVAADRGAFTMADALRLVCDKLVRRHPHIFVQPDAAAGTDGHGVTTPGAVVAQWEQIKARERAAAGRPRESALDDIPAALPALQRARELGRRAAKAGFDWPDPAAVWEKVLEEVEEVRVELAEGRQARLAEELGDMFFSLAQFARKAGIDPELALRAANTKFASRFRTLERRVADQGDELHRLHPDDLEKLWQQIKHDSNA
jgi:MazG family protein